MKKLEPKKGNGGRDSCNKVGKQRKGGGNKQEIKNEKQEIKKESHLL